MSSRRSASTSGTEAGATIEVWKAWLTGMRTALMPAAVNVSMICLDRGRRAADHGLGVGVDVGDHDVAGRTPTTIRSISASGPKTAAIAPLSSMLRLAISCPRALTASSADSKVSEPAATRAPYSPRL